MFMFLYFFLCTFFNTPKKCLNSTIYKSPNIAFLAGEIIGKCHIAVTGNIHRHRHVQPQFSCCWEFETTTRTNLGKKAGTLFEIPRNLFWRIYCTTPHHFDTFTMKSYICLLALHVCLSVWPSLIWLHIKTQEFHIWFVWISLLWISFKTYYIITTIYKLSKFAASAFHPELLLKILIQCLFLGRTVHLWNSVFTLRILSSGMCCYVFY